MTYKYPNVDLNKNIANAITQGEVVVPPFLAELVDKLAVTYPTWCIVAKNYSRPRADGCIEAQHFEVLNNENPRKNVGTIGVTNRHHHNRGTELCYRVSCHRMAMERERGNELHTKDLKNALKAVKKYFTPPSVSDRLDEIRDRAASTARSVLFLAESRQRSDLMDLTPAMLKFVSSNVESFTATLEPTGLDPALLQNVLRIQNELVSLAEFNKAISAHKVLTMFSVDGKYVVHYDNAISSWDSSELPPEVRERVGMLKLLDVLQVNPSIGMRTGDGGFVIHLPADYVFPSK